MPLFPPVAVAEKQSFDRLPPTELYSYHNLYVKRFVASRRVQLFRFEISTTYSVLQIMNDLRQLLSIRTDRIQIR